MITRNEDIHKNSKENRFVIKLGKNTKMEWQKNNNHQPHGTQLNTHPDVPVDDGLVFFLLPKCTDFYFNQNYSYGSLGINSYLLYPTPVGNKKKMIVKHNGMHYNEENVEMKHLVLLWCVDCV